MIFDCSTNVNFAAIKAKKKKSKKNAVLTYVIYTCSIKDLNHHMYFWYLPHMGKGTF